MLRRLLTQLKAVLAQVEGALPEDEYEGLQAASVQSRMELGDARRPEEKKRRVALGLGFSLHADTAAHGNDREGLARLCRYASRGPVAEERLQRLPDGRYQYATKKGAVLVLTAHALVKRLVALVPPARVHLTSSHGVYAANARLRPVVLQPEPQSAAPAPSSVKEEAPDKAKPRRPPRLVLRQAQEGDVAGEDVRHGCLEVPSLRRSTARRGVGDESANGFRSYS